jgi:hypothetical protein
MRARNMVYIDTGFVEGALVIIPLFLFFASLFYLFIFFYGFFRQYVPEKERTNKAKLKNGFSLLIVH